MEGVAFSPDGRTLAAIGFEKIKKVVRLWNTNSRRVMAAHRWGWHGVGLRDVRRFLTRRRDAGHEQRVRCEAVSIPFWRDDN